MYILLHVTGKLVQDLGGQVGKLALAAITMRATKASLYKAEFLVFKNFCINLYTFNITNVLH